MTSSNQETAKTLLKGIFLPKFSAEVCGRCRIIVVDDEPIVRGLALALLERFGFSQVDEASDGATALNLLEQHDYRLVISDHFMEPMDGVSLFRAMRADPRMHAIPFLMLTASMSHSTVAQAKKAGIQHYVVKPFRLASFHRKLGEILLPYGVSEHH